MTNPLKIKAIKLYFALLFFAITSFYLSSCSDAETIINNVISNEVTAKDRLTSAITQAKAAYGDTTNLVLIFGKNVKSNGKTDITLITGISNPDSVGAWLYIFKSPNDTSLRIYTPNPTPGFSDCIELTALFNINSLLVLIQDTSARNMISGALNVVINSNITISTLTSNLIDSDVSLGFASSTNPIIKFNANFAPDTSSLNGNVFFSTGANKTINMILIPAAGTLNLPQYIQNLTGFPNDLWIVQYKKTNSISQQENLILGTVVQSGQMMSIPPPIGISSPVINLSKYVAE
jgi:hypothetical protein